MTDSVLVIGASGFIGKHLVRPLAECVDSVGAVRRRQETLTVCGDESAIRDYLYIDDFVAPCVAVFAKPMPPGRQILNASSGVGVRLDALLEQIAAVSGRALPRMFAPRPAVDAARLVIDASKARHAYDWTPATELSEGLRQTWRWFSTTQQ